MIMPIPHDTTSIACTRCSVSCTKLMTLSENLSRFAFRRSEVCGLALSWTPGCKIKCAIKCGCMFWAPSSLPVGMLQCSVLFRHAALQALRTLQASVDVLPWCHQQLMGWTIVEREFNPRHSRGRQGSSLLYLLGARPP